MNLTDIGELTNLEKTISIRSNNNRIVEGQSVVIQFTVGSVPDPNFTFTYTPTFTASAENTADFNYLDETDGASGVQRVSSSEMTLQEVEETGEYTAQFEVSTKPVDGVDMHGGTLSIALISSSPLRGSSETLLHETDRTVTTVVLDSLNPELGNLVRLAVNFDTDNIAESVDEGEDAVFILKSDTAAFFQFDVELRVNQFGNFIGMRIPTHTTFEFNESRAEFRIMTDDDLQDERTGRIEVVMVNVDDDAPYFLADENTTAHIFIRDDDRVDTTGTRYTVAEGVMRFILDNPIMSGSGEPMETDTGSPFPVISISSRRLVIEEGETATFVVASDSAISGTLLVQVVLTDSSELIEGELNRTVTIGANVREATLSVPTVDDDVPEADGKITASIVGGGEYLVAAEDRASVQVTDRRDQELHGQRAVAANSAVTPVILTAMGDRSIRAVNNRIGKAFSGSGQTAFALGGQSSVTGLIVAGGRELNDDPAGLKSRLANSSFSINLFPEEGVPGSTTVWGFGSSGIVSDRYGSRVDSWNGELSIGHLGFDTRVGEELLLGTSASMVTTEVDYAVLGGSDLKYDSQFTGIHPYLGYRSIDGTTSLRATAGYAVGLLGINHPEQVPIYSGSSIHSTALNGSHQVHSGDSPMGGEYLLEITGESFQSGQIVTDGVDFASRLRANTSRYQMAANIRNEQFLSVGGLSPSAAVGIRGNAVNNRSLIGTHLATGLNFDSSTGLKLSNSGNALIGNNFQVENLKFESTLVYDQHPDKTGYHFEISTNWIQGESIGGYSFNQDRSNVEDDLFAQSHQSEGLEVEMAGNYGIAVLDGTGVLVPGGEIDYEQSHHIGFTVRNRLELDQDFAIELSGTKKIPEIGESDHKLRLRGNYQW